MKVIRKINFIIYIILIFGFLAAGCGGSSDGLPPSYDGNNTPPDNGNIEASSQVVATIILTADPVSVSKGGISTVTATVLDQDNNQISASITVSFTVSDNTLGTIGSSAKTLNGKAMVDFTASSDNVGSVTITAKAENISQTVMIEVTE